MKRTASPAQADRERYPGRGYAALGGSGVFCGGGVAGAGSVGGAAADSIWRPDLEVLSIQNGHLMEKIWRSTPDFQELTEAKVFQTFGEDKSGSVKWPYCMVRTSSGRE